MYKNSYSTLFKFAPTKMGTQGVLVKMNVINFVRSQMMFSETENLGINACQVWEVAVEWAPSGFIYKCYSFVG